MKNGNVHNLIISIKPYGVEMSCAIVSALLKQIFIIASSVITSYIVGLALEKNMDDKIIHLAGILGICVILRAVSTYGEMWFAHDVAFRVIRNFRLDLYKKISQISPAYTLREKTGKLGQALIGDVEILELFLAHTFSGFIVAVITTVSIMVVLLTINPILAFLLLTASFLLGIVPYALKKRASREGEDVRKRLAETNALMVEVVQGLREIITLNYKGTYKRCFESQMQGLYDAQQLYGKRKGIESMSAQIICGVFTVVVMLVSAVLVINHEISFSVYPIVVMLSTIVLSPVMEAVSVAQELGLVFAASNRIQDVLHTKPAVLNQGRKECECKPCSIAFEHVSFRYEKGSNEPVLKDVSFCIKPGETVVIVGHSGAGKSTCANLLLRYWDVEEGCIKINGTDIREYAIDNLREMISAVPQETYLFHDTIRNNIRIGKINASDLEIEQAAKTAMAHAFIMNMPERYDTITGERGYQLSGGQRQRIAIARTLLRDTPIVIFDEVVSNLDADNEQYIQKALKELLKEKTVVTIAHRLSTILAADKVIMLENGQLVAVGKHEELIKKNKKYQDLLKNQL